MELRVLKYFLAVAREESISKAAESLHVTQPTLSRQLMELEEQLGVILLIRSRRNRGISLTNEGMLLRKRAEEIVELAHRAEIELTSDSETISGDVYIGGGETEGMRLIAKAAKALQEKYPHIKYHLFSGNADDVRERLDKGLLDFGVFIEPAAMERYDYMRLPAVDTWGLLMRKDCSLAEKSQIVPQDIYDLPLLTSRQNLVYHALSSWLERDLASLNVVGTYNLIYNASLMVEEGVGYALCLDRLINTTGDSSLCFRPFEPKLEVNMDIVWRKHQVFSKEAELFLKKLQVLVLE